MKRPALSNEAEMLAAIFGEGPKPCAETLRRWRKRRIIPFYKFPKGIFYDIEAVREQIEKRQLVRAR